MTPELTVLYEDNHCLAVAKPAPLLTQGAPVVPSLEAMVKAYIKERYNKPGNVYLGVPHRLDRPVSGVVVFGATVRPRRGWRSSLPNGRRARSTGRSSSQTRSADFRRRKASGKTGF